MKFPILLTILLISACSTSGGVEKVSQPSDANGLMMSNVDARTIADCMARSLSATLQQENDGFLITPSLYKVTYRIIPFNDPLKRYVTRVDVIGDEPIFTANNPALCLNKK